MPEMPSTISFASAFADEIHLPFEQHSGSGLAALCIHGFPGTPADMRSVGTLLHEADWHVSAPLLPGFGIEIDALPDKRLDDWLTHIEAHYHALRQHARHIVLLGLSMGGAIAAQLAARLRPDALILLAPFWKIQHPLWLAMPYLKHIVPIIKPFKLFKPDFNDPATRAGIANFLPQADLSDPEIQRLVVEFAIPLGMIDQVRRAGIRGYAALPHITCPTLVIQGRQDELVPASTTRRYIQRFNLMPEYVEVDGEHVLTDPHAASWPAVSAAITQFATIQRQRFASKHD